MQTKIYPTVTLCGSARFEREFEAMNAILTMEGSVVLTPGVYKDYFGRPLTEEEKDRLGKMHLHKIDLSDAVIVIDVGGYIGENTRREIEYARQQGKIITRLSEHPEWLEKIEVATEVKETSVARGIAHNYYSGDDQPFVGILWDETDSNKLELTGSVHNALRQYEGETVEILVRSFGIQKHPRMRIQLSDTFNYEPVLWDQESPDT
ncbi:MAG: hypothetical protein ACYCVB_02635 [Bacilli bacterium]